MQRTETVQATEAVGAGRRSPGLDLFLISFLSLYLELLVIRWLASEIRIFAYFKNVPLMASLFGLGLGMALAGRRFNLTPYFPISFLAVAALISLAEPLGLVHVTFLDPLEHQLLGGVGLSHMEASSLASYLGKGIFGLFVLVAVFYLIVIMFMSIGQELGRLFDRFRPLSAYSINVGGAILGIALFSAMSFLCYPPYVWVGTAAVLSLWFYRRPHHWVVLAAAVAIVLATQQAHIHWSPYYRISVSPALIHGDKGDKPHRYGYQINVNHDAMEGAYDNSPLALVALSDSQRKKVLDFYEMVYAVLGDGPRSVLILAAGAGNDAASALRHGARSVIAVDIDPMILKLGCRIHPEKPYSDPRVKLVSEDARAYLQRDRSRYDLINFAYIDSQSAFSSMSSIRLDNYIYTQESFRDAYRHLSDDGVMAVSFFSRAWWQQIRLFKTLELATGVKPVGVWSPNRTALTYFIGPGFNLKRAQESGLEITDESKFREMVPDAVAKWDGIDPTTDDWPFFFLRQRGMTLSYAIGLIFTVFLGWRLVGLCFGRYTADPLGRAMFFLGAAFMLVEVRALAQMGLLLGTTWMVNSAVITGILVMILLATLAQIRWQFRNLPLLYGLLAACLLVSYFTPFSLLNNLPFLARAIAGTVVLSLPVLFSSLVFAITFSKVGSAHNALGMNLLGTLVGGCLEYLSMLSGINALNLIAVALYMAALFFWLQAARHKGLAGASSARSG